MLLELCFVFCSLHPALCKILSTEMKALSTETRLLSYEDEGKLHLYIGVDDR